MISNWDQLSGILDEAVDAMLGDRVLYKRRGDGGYTEIDAFVILETGPVPQDEFDETVAVLKRVKVSKAIIPVVDPGDRIQHERLGPETYGPGGGVPETQGRYWLFDVQRVTTNT